jgi:hypothetical protein
VFAAHRLPGGTLSISLQPSFADAPLNGIGAWTFDCVATAALRRRPLRILCRRLPALLLLRLSLLQGPLPLALLLLGLLWRLRLLPGCRTERVDQRPTSLLQNQKFITSAMRCSVSSRMRTSRLLKNRMLTADI